jgi:hypothetical protein
MPKKSSSKSSSQNKSGPKKAAARAPQAQLLLEDAPVGSQAEYERLLPMAMKLSAAAVRPMRVEASLALQNGQRGVDAVLPCSAQISKDLPQVSLAAIEELSNMGLAVAYAAGQLDRLAPAPSETRALVARATELRALMLGAAQVLALAGVLPQVAIKKIRQGHGAIDAAGDCVALAALYQGNADAVRGKTPVSAAQVREASDLGSRLLTILKPASAGRKAKNKEAAEMADKRDRLWTLYESTWEDHVWRAGAWVFKREVDASVPSLHSRVVGKRVAKPGAPGAATVEPGGGV